MKSILKSATTAVLQLPVTLGIFSLGSANPISIDPQNLEIGFVRDFSVIDQQNVYLLKAVFCRMTHMFTSKFKTQITNFKLAFCSFFFPCFFHFTLRIDSGYVDHYC